MMNFSVMGYATFYYFNKVSFIIELFRCYFFGVAYFKRRMHINSSFISDCNLNAYVRWAFLNLLFRKISKLDLFFWGGFPYIKMNKH